ncbi:MAG: acetate--CoA ligase family protein [Candidatus Micrarchaeales archaeon]
MELIDYMKAKALLQRYHIRSIDSKYVSSAADAVSFSNGAPIVLKVISQKALHKSKNGLVALDISSQKEIESSYKKINKNAQKFKPYKILAQKMLKNGLEIIIGCKTDPQFGKMILIGLGGIYVETFKDFALRVCPITKYDAESMIAQLKSGPVIAPDKKATKMIVDMLINTSKMFSSNDITEMDLNPLILHDGTYDAVDLRIIR